MSHESHKSHSGLQVFRRSLAGASGSHWGRNPIWRETMYQWLKHAFALESPDSAVPTASQADLIDRVCRETVRRQMGLPALMMLESSAPLHFLAGQTLRFFEPFLSTVLDAKEIRDFAEFIEHQGAVESICRRLAELQADQSQMTNVDQKLEHDPTD